MNNYEDFDYEIIHFFLLRFIVESSDRPGKNQTKMSGVLRGNDYSEHKFVLESR